MKKFLTIGVAAFSLVYYTCLPFVVAQAGENPVVSKTAAAAAPAPVVKAAPTDATDTATLYMRITAYASVPNETDDTPFVTADGSYVHDGIAASNILPFGTKIQIPALFGNKIFVVHDRMSKKIKNTVDIWMSSVNQAFHFGAEHANIVILGAGTSSLALAKNQ